MLSTIFKIKNKGFAAIFVLVILMSLSLVVAYSLSTIIITRSLISSALLKSAQSYYSSESGIEDALLRVMKSYNYTAINNFNLGDSAVTQNITSVGDVTTIESLSSHFGNQRKVKTEITMNVDGIGFHYGVQVGEGGLTMANNSEIDGNLYSNGNVVGSSNSSSKINGDVSVATGMSLDHSHSVYNAETEFGDAAPVIDVAQSFKASSSEIMSQISFYIKRIGNVTDKTIRVFTDDGSGGAQPGSPTKTQVGSTTLIASKVGENYGWVDFSFSTPPFLTADQWYWVVIDTASDSKYFVMAKDSNNGNGNGLSKYSPNWDAVTPVWTLDTGDYNFKLWLGGIATSLDTVNVIGTARAHTIDNSDIGVDAYAKNINSTDVVGAAHYEVQFTGTSGSSVQETVNDPVVAALPISDSNIADWEAAATAGGIFSDTAHCSPTVDITLDACVLDCDFVPTPGIVITVNGTIWVKGDVTIGVGTGIKLSSAYGGNSGVIIADKHGSESTVGKIVVLNNVAICGSQGFLPGNSPFTCDTSNGSYIMLLSTHNHSSTYAIDVSNNADGAIFYAHKGIANINNLANLKEVTAYKLNLSQNTKVTYESGLANASFSSGPEGGWTIESWNEIE
ncbi:MAG: hypothetical protein KAI71_05275 [Candidatus Pacebacteria bacterium]|nr:hypothetical protein [Candidatus Paceibacterota bacterium]